MLEKKPLVVPPHCSMCVPYSPKPDRDMIYQYRGLNIFANLIADHLSMQYLIKCYWMLSFNDGYRHCGTN